MARKPGGKSNATTHGAYAKDLFLPGERPKEFELLHQGLIDEWKPIGTLEDDTVLTLAQCIWLKRRADGFYHQQAVDSQFENADETRFVIYLTNVLEHAETLEQATTFISKLPKEYGQWIEEQVPRSKFEDDKSWIKSLKPQILILARERERFERLFLKGKEHRSAILRELTVQKIAVDERLDTRMDKAVKRLAQLKTFKQIVAEQASRARSIDQHNIGNQPPQKSTN